MREQVGFAGFPNHVGHLGHAVMHGQGLGLLVLDQTEQGANAAKGDADQHQGGAADAAQPGEFHRVQRWNFDVRLTGERVGGEGKQAKHSKCPQ